MERIKYRISLDMFEVASQTTIKAKKGDTACSIFITLTENGKVYKIDEGCTAFFSAKKPDGNYLFNSETCRIEDNTIIYDFTEQTTPIEGIVECEVVLKKGEDKLTSPRFNLKVDATVYNGEEIISTPEADALKELTDRAEEIVNQYDEGIIVGKGYVDNNFANALKGSASGKVVAIKDVSSVQHNVKVKASAATNVNVYGKNLVDDSLKSGTPPNIFFDTKNYSTKHTTLKAGTYTLSAKIRDGVGGRTFLYVLDADNKYVTLHSTAQSTLTFTLTETKTLNFKVYNEKFTDINDLEWAQLECGSATEYEPYIAPVTHPVSADGTDIKSVYPSMTFVPEANGVELSVEYNRDINKAFAQLQAALISMGGNI